MMQLAFSLKQKVNSFWSCKTIINTVIKIKENICGGSPPILDGYEFLGFSMINAISPENRNDKTHIGTVTTTE